MPRNLARYRADHLAALPDHLQGLPKAFTDAVTAYRCAMAMPVTRPDGRAVARATADTAVAAFAAAVAHGSTTIKLDTAPIAAARAADQEAEDKAQLAVALRDAAVAGLCQTADTERDRVIRALKDAHATIIADLIGHARRLPDPCDDKVALERGGAVRDSWLACRDLAAFLERLRGDMEVVDDDVRGFTRGSARGLFHIRDLRVYDHASRYPEPGNTVAYYLKLARETVPADWWNPTRQEIRDLSEALHDEQEREQRRARLGERPGIYVGA